MDASILAERLLALQGRSIMVVGDVMLDRFVDGTVNRLSPEAPVPILEKTQDSVMPGGAANVAINLAGLGCDVTLLSVTGNDAAGRQLAQILGANLAIDFHRIVDGGRPTTTKTRFRADKQQILLIDGPHFWQMAAPDRSMGGRVSRDDQIGGRQKADSAY